MGIRGPKFNQKKLEEIAAEAKLRFILFGDGNSSSPIPFGRTENPRRRGIVGDLMNGIESRLEELFGLVLFETELPLMGTMVPRVDFALNVERNYTVWLEGVAYMSENGTEESHPMWYWHDQGIPATTFSKTTPLLTISERSRFPKNKLEVLPPQPPARKSNGRLLFHRYMEGDTRPAIAPTNWSNLIAKRFEKQFSSIAEGLDWELNVVVKRFD